MQFVNSGMEGRREGGGVLQTLARGLDLLLLFSEVCPALSIAEIAAALRVPRPTAYRLVRTLRSRGLVHEAGPSTYGLGWSVLSLAQVAEAGLDLARLLYPIMLRLHARTGETVMLTAAAGLSGVCLERIESRHSVRLSVTKGRRIALHAGASAKALLAFLPKATWERVIAEAGLPRFTPRTITRPALLRSELCRIRRQGYAVSLGELDDGAWAVAAPVLAPDRQLVAALTLAGPLTRFERAALPRLVRHVREAVGAASAALHAQAEATGAGSAGRTGAAAGRANGWPSRARTQVMGKEIARYALGRTAGRPGGLDPATGKSE
jgi:DNA-binding IclR family transcriptional regulator